MVTVMGIDDLVRRLTIRADFHQAAVLRADRAQHRRSEATDHENRCGEYHDAIFALTAQQARIAELEAALEPYSASPPAVSICDEEGARLASEERTAMTTPDLAALEAAAQWHEEAARAHLINASLFRPDDRNLREKWAVEDNAIAAAIRAAVEWIKAQPTAWRAVAKTAERTAAEQMREQCALVLRTRREMLREMRERGRLTEHGNARFVELEAAEAAIRALPIEPEGQPPAISIRDEEGARHASESEGKP